MEYRNLGKSGLKVSEICLGTMTFGSNADETESGNIIDLALNAGVNFIDCADAYAEGESEKILGRALQGRRKDVILASKCFNPMGSGPNDGGLSRVHIMRAAAESLRRLQTDYIDIYYLHHVDRETPLEEMLRAMEDLVRQGKVRYIACSNFEGWRLLESIWISDTKGWDRFICYQPQYNLLVRDIEHEIVPVCTLKGLGIVPYSPLANGFLTGKYKPGQRKLEGTRSADEWNFYNNAWSPKADEILKAVLDISQAIGRTPAQVAIRWILEQPMVTSAIIGARNTAQARENLLAGGWRLPSQSLEKLNAVSAREKRYPRNTEPFYENRRMTSIDMPSLKDT